MPVIDQRRAALLRCDGLNTYYGKSHVLHDVSFEVQPGTSVGLLGRNGMGKTTLIKSCLGLVADVRGSVAYRGARIAGLAPEQIACLGVGYVPEGRGIFASLSVRENLLVSARAGPTGECFWDLGQVLNLFPRLAERLNHGGAQLSGGEQQMLAIGRALMTNPELLVIDEVTEGLAPLLMKEIWSTLDVVRRRGVSCLLVDRSYQAILRNTDVCLFVEKGHVVWEGPSHMALYDGGLLERYLGV